MASRPSLDDYVDVAERIQDFKDAHPEGSLQTLNWEVVTVTARDIKTSEDVPRTFIVYRAAAYRHPDDPSPGHGIAWEPFPGRTPYTRDSELMNAETAAWGRAICALGLVSNRSLASRQEVRNRRADQAADLPTVPTVHPTNRRANQASDGTSDAAESAAHQPVGQADTQIAPKGATAIDDSVVSQLFESYKQSGLTRDELCWLLLSIGVESLPEDPSGSDVNKAVQGLSLEQAFKLDALIKGEDEGVPGAA